MFHYNTIIKFTLYMHLQAAVGLCGIKILALYNISTAAAELYEFSLIAVAMKLWTIQHVMSTKPQLQLIFIHPKYTELSNKHFLLVIK